MPFQIASVPAPGWRKSRKPYLFRGELNPRGAL